MRKIIVFLLFLALFAGLIAPAIVFGDEGIRECCKVRRDIDFGDDYGGACDKNDIAAPDVAAGAVCYKGTGTLNSVCGLESWGMFCVVSTVYYVTDWIFYLMMILVVILFIVAGAIYLTSAGSEESMKRAKNIMLYAIVGLVVALIAKLVPSVVKLIVAM